MTSDTTSSSRGVDVQTKGAARLSGRKRMLFDGHGVRFYPSQVNADLDVSLVNINGGPIRRRLAVSVFEQQREQARLESKSRAEERVAERMDQGLNEVQGRLAQGPAKRYMEPLFVRQPGIVRHWRTTTDMLEGRFWSADPFEFASPTPPPTAATARGVTMQLHQSFLERMLRKQLAGRTLNQEQMAAESDTWFMRGKEERPEHSGPNWHVSFADSLPAKVRITGNEVRIVMFCTQFASEKGEFPGQQVSLTYGVQCRDDKLILARHGDVGIMPIDYVDGTEIHFSGRQQVLRRIMQRSFEKQFPAEIALAGFEPSAGNGLKEAMGFNRATADEGWLSLVMEPRGQTANVAKAQAGTTHQ